MTPNYQVSIIILNWNGLVFLKPCLDSLKKQDFPPSEFEIILVDNGSTDNSVEWIKGYFREWQNETYSPGLKLVELPQNTGFSAGNRQGLENSQPATKYIVTLNNDTLPEPGWLKTLVQSLEAKPGYEKWAAAGGPMLFMPLRERDRKSPQKALIASGGIEIYRNGLALDRRVGEALKQGEPEEEVFGVCAGAAIYKREAIEEVGFFDPIFFAYLEDADLAWRLRLAGWKALYVPEAIVWHEFSGTGKQGSSFKNFQLGRNRLWTIFKNWPLAFLLRYSLSILFYDFSASIYTLLKGNSASLKGRLAALNPPKLGYILKQRRQILKNRKISDASLEKWLAPSPKAGFLLSLEKITNKGASKPIENPHPQP